MSYRAVIFDLFGTLVDAWPKEAHLHALERMAQTVGAQADDFIRLWGETFYERSSGKYSSIEGDITNICARLGITANPQSVPKAAQIRNDLAGKTLLPRDDAVATLRAIRASSRKVGLVSNCTSEILSLWPTTAFAGLFDSTIFSAQAGIMKPDPRIYEMACEALQTKPAGCLYVGDGEHDELGGAARVGMHPVLIRVSGSEPESGFFARPTDWDGHVISSLSEVLNVIRFLDD